MSGATADGWQGILDPDERILWQGRPDGAVALRAGNVLGAIFGLLFGGFALFWMVMAGTAGGLVFALFGLPFLLVGAGLVWAAIWFDAFRRRRSWYSLSNCRAFIATNMPIVGKRLRSWPITASTPIDYKPGELSTIHFAHETRSGDNGTWRVPIGFERIADGEEVYRLIRGIQRGEA